MYGVGVMEQNVCIENEGFDHQLNLHGSMKDVLTLLAEYYNFIVSG
jgi:hypothetical protein